MDAISVSLTNPALDSFSALNGAGNTSHQALHEGCPKGRCQCWWLTAQHLLTAHLGTAQIPAPSHAQQAHLSYSTHFLGFPCLLTCIPKQVLNG